jgi:hypothetical protein
LARIRIKDELWMRNKLKFETKIVDMNIVIIAHSLRNLFMAQGQVV